MPTENEIRAALERLKKPYGLRRVELFGSYAEGRATNQSDIDLLAEFNQPRVSPITLNALIYDLEDSPGLPVDVIHAPLPQGGMITPGKVVRVP